MYKCFFQHCILLWDWWRRGRGRGKKIWKILCPTSYIRMHMNTGKKDRQPIKMLSCGSDMRSRIPTWLYAFEKLVSFCSLHHKSFLEMRNVLSFGYEERKTWNQWKYYFGSDTYTVAFTSNQGYLHAYIRIRIRYAISARIYVYIVLFLLYFWYWWQICRNNTKTMKIGTFLQFFTGILLPHWFGYLPT